MREFEKSEKVIVALGESAEGLVVIIGVSEAAWQAMAAQPPETRGRTHTVDLRKVSPILPRIVLMRGKDQQAIAEELGDASALLGKLADLGIDTPRSH